MKHLIAILFLASCILSCTSTATKNWTVGAKVHGFTLQEVVPVDEINGLAYFFVHDKTKSTVLYLSNDDNNKNFAISFKTPPQDSTGVFHIFEHSVLAGTEKYPSKSLFFQVAGSSVNTFQNAMTFGDKTVYPVASTNEQDFKNMVGIYLDSVFFPNVLSNKKIFEREGWRYEVDKDNKLSYNGIVFSEMKGAYSDPTRFLWKATEKSLFTKNSAYYHESGGDVVDISDLTYEQLQATHKKYYNPSNSQVIFYGNGSIADHLKIVDQGYFSKIAPNFEKIEIPTESPKEKMVTVNATYPAAATEKDLKNKVMFTRSYKMENILPARDYYGMMVLTTALSAFENSPLKKNLISKKICKEVGADMDSIKTPLFVVVCRGSSKDKQKAFNREVESILAQVQSKGIAKDLLEAALNTIEFQRREYNTIHRGLTATFRVLDSWLYDGHPLAYVRYSTELDWIRNQRPENWAQALVQRYITSSAHQSLVSATPDTQMMARIEKKLADKLKIAEQKIGLQNIAKNFKEFTDWNKEPVPVEIQNKVPKLKVADLDKKQKTIPMLAEEKSGIKYLKHEIPSQGIVYSSLYFDLNSIPEAWVPYLPLLAESIGRVSTKSYKYEDLDVMIYKVSGGITASVKVFPRKGDPNNYDARFVVSLKSLQPNLEESLKILKSVLLESKFDSSARMAELFSEMHSGMESNIGSAAFGYSSSNSMAKLSSSGRFNNALSGIPQLSFLREMAQKKNFAQVNKQLATISKAIFQKNNLVIGLGYDTPAKELVQKGMDTLLAALPAASLKDAQPTFAKQNLFDGASFSGQVQFLTSYSQSQKMSQNYGTMLAVTKLTSSMFLLPTLREQGGAYGGGMNVSTSGELGYYTYRDPRLDESYKDLQKVPQFLRSFPNDQSLVDNAILKTIGGMDYPMTAREQVAVSDSYYFKQITDADLQTYRDQVFSLNVSTVRALAKDIEDANSKSQMSVIGYKPKLESSPMMQSKKIISL